VLYLIYSYSWQSEDALQKTNQTYNFSFCSGINDGISHCNHLASLCAHLLCILDKFSQIFLIELEIFTIHLQLLPHNGILESVLNIPKLSVRDLPCSKFFCQTHKCHTQKQRQQTQSRSRNFHTYTNVTHRNKGSRHIQGQEILHIYKCHTQKQRQQTHSRSRNFHTYTNVAHRNKGSRHIQAQEIFTHIKMDS